jgi:hypothetical protein
MHEIFIPLFFPHEKLILALVDTLLSYVENIFKVDFAEIMAGVDPVDVE